MCEIYLVHVRYNFLNYFYIDWNFVAPPIWEHKGGNVPISFFGSPFEILSSDTRHCLHGNLQVRQKIDFSSNIIFFIIKIKLQ